MPRTTYSYRNLKMFPDRTIGRQCLDSNETKHCKVIIRVIIYQITRMKWPRSYINITDGPADGRTDRQLTVVIPRFALRNMIICTVIIEKLIVSKTVRLLDLYVQMYCTLYAALYMRHRVE